MRRTRLLLLLAILVIVSAVAGTYYFRRSLQEGMTPPPPPPLPLNVNAEGKDWIYKHDEGNRTVVEVRARKMTQVQDPSTFNLEGVELRMFDADGQKYNHVGSAFATFDTASGQLYSEGEVDITLGLPIEGEPPQDPVTIHSSGVHFEAATGKATTDRHSTFRFRRAAGEAVGASYDPRSKDLRMHSAVKVHFRPEDPKRQLMVVEAGELVYKEDQNKVYLSPWSRFRQGALTLDAANSIVNLEDDHIKFVEADRARGTDQYPSRKIDYAASHLLIDFTPKSEVSRVVGETDATVTAASDTAETKISSDRIFLNFEPSEGDSILKEAIAVGKGVLESKPVPRAGIPPPETRILRSEFIKTYMRPGGREIDTTETQAPGSIEFLPNGPEQKRRRVDGERIWLHYGETNRLKALRVQDVSTRTEPLPPKGDTSNGKPPDKPMKPPAPMLTWSKHMLAEFDPKTSDMSRMEQSGNFRYEEGARKATAGSAELKGGSNMITLREKARVWDDTGVTAADTIFLNQNEGTVFAEGHVSSTRLPDQKPGASGMLSQNEPLHATAEKMATSDDNTKILYEGNAVLWQESNRLEAQRIEIDRKARLLFAHGQVTNQIVEKPARGKTEVNGNHNGPQKAGFMVVKAEELFYDDNERRAHYKTNVSLSRAAMDVKAAELQAFFTKPPANSTSEGSDASLDHAIADGQVRIVQRQPDRTRIGTAEHSEYYVSDEKVLLSGGKPKLEDSLRGTAEGRQLTYFARNDRLLIDGAEGQRAVSQLHRK